MPDPYQVLGVAPSASEADVRTAYLWLAKKFHPDTNPGDTRALEWFQEIERAYSLIQAQRAEDRSVPPTVPKDRRADVVAQAPPNCTMKELIDKMVDDYQPNAGKAVAKSIGMTILKTGLMNVLTLPFGRVSVGVATYKSLTKEQFRGRIVAALYPKVLETKHNKDTAWFRRLIQSYDSAPIDTKVSLVTMALKDQTAYLKMILGKVS